jgi:SRF-type transcription factor (DNA-binding and dimerisation domain)
MAFRNPAQGPTSYYPSGVNTQPPIGQQQQQQQDDHYPVGTSPTIRSKRPRPLDMQADDGHQHPGSGTAIPDQFIQDQEANDEGDDEDEDEGEGKKSDKKAGRRKIKIEFIQDKSRRHITFSKRKAGIMKKVICHLALRQCPHLPSPNLTGIRTLDLDRNPGSASCGFRNWPRLHFHHGQIATIGDTT